MALRRLLGVAVFALCAATGCKDKGASKTTGLDGRCAQLARVCGDQAKHIEKITGECREAAAKQTEKSCVDKANAAYDCYEGQLCGAEKVWALDDFRVLADRHKKCTAERDALRDCVNAK
jgi:hypothetical protein